MDGGSLVSSGIDGLDTLLKGGFPSNRAYMVRGRSGAGKTITGYHFLDEGLGNGENDAKFVFIDGTAGYELNLHSEGSDFRKELHALARYLRNLGVTVVITDEIQDVTGSFRASDSHVSYLADNIVFLRYIEVRGDVQKAIGVLKKRYGSFESALRSFHVGTEGIHIGDPLDNLRGVLTGTPTWEGETEP